MKYTPVIGLEVHVELKTKSKMFCGCSADYFGKEPNTLTCPVCLGLPGALPVPNKKAINWCVMIGIALNCEIPLFSKFDRKNYFYPDLPKGYQISQYDQPFAINGKLKLDSGKEIRIRRVHMEEDTAKLTHQGEYSLIDFNRSGVPLVEIVTEPDFDNAQDVKAYLKKLQQIVRDLDVSDANMERGDMRLEPNISLRPEGQSDLPKYKVEVKNINSFNFVGKAIEFEIERQAEILDKGEIPAQETRGFVESSSSTVSQRSKEEAADYRYFPEPDIPPIRWSESQISSIKSEMPGLSEEKIKRITKLGVKESDAKILSQNKSFIKIFEDVTALGVDPQKAANGIINKKIDLSKSPDQIAKEITSLGSVSTVNEDELNKAIEGVLASNQKAVEDFKSGKETVIMYLVGQVMRQFKERIDAEHVKSSLLAKIK